MNCAGTRRDRDAQKPAGVVAGRARARAAGVHDTPGLQVELLGMTTLGDRILDRPLSQEGGKGLFVKELELALLDGRAQLAVHSLKDVPMQLADRIRTGRDARARGSARLHGVERATRRSTTCPQVRALERRACGVN